MKPEVLQQLASEFGSPLYVLRCGKIAIQYKSDYKTPLAK